MKKPGTVDLDALFVERTVKLDGKEIVVAPLDGVSYQLLKNVTEEDALLTMYEIGKRCLSGIPEERIMKLSAPQIGALIGVARSAIEEVEAIVPKQKPSKGRKGALSTT